MDQVLNSPEEHIVPHTTFPGLGHLLLLVRNYKRGKVWDISSCAVMSGVENIEVMKDLKALS